MIVPLIRRPCHDRGNDAKDERLARLPIARRNPTKVNALIRPPGQ
jgi:hypothetical protein